MASDFWLKEHSLRMLGQNFTLTRSQWEDLSLELRPDSELRERIEEMLYEASKDD